MTQNLPNRPQYNAFRIAIRLGFVLALLVQSGLGYADSFTEDSTLIPPTLLSANATVIDSVSCFGAADGKAMAEGNGGSTPYSFLWSNGSTADSAINLAAGMHYVSITDSVGNVAVDSVLIVEPDLLVVVLDSLKNVTCYGGSDGSISVGFAGGNDTVSYAWSTASINYVVVGLSIGSYSVTITDVRGCQDSAVYSIVQPDTLVFIDSALITDAYCFGGEVGAIQVNGTGGNGGPYSYVWNEGSTTDSIFGLGSGTYVVSVSDALGCEADSAFSVNEPSGAGNASIAATQITCYGDSNGSMVASFVGGNAPYSYAWSNGVDSSLNDGLSAGTFTVTIYDADGCTQTAEDSIVQPDPIVIATAVLSTPACHGDSTGAIAASFQGGVLPYVALWSQGTAGDTLAAIPGGNYVVTVTDSAGCLRSDTILLPQPDPLQLDSFIGIQPTCYGLANGSISTQFAGGSLPYSYAWSLGDTTSAISNLPSGTFMLTVTDSNACIADTSFDLSQPDSLELMVVLVDTALCPNTDDGSLVVAALGGTPSYAFLWNDGTPLDSLNQTATGTYTVTVTDMNGCNRSDSFVLPYLHELPTAGLDASEVFCNQDSAILSALPGHASYVWNTGSTSFETVVNTSGTYAVTMVSAEGCQSADSTMVTFAASSAMTLGNDTVICVDGDTVAALLFPIPNSFESYAWSTGDSTLSISVQASGTYHLTVTNADGCTTADTVVVAYEDCLGVEHLVDADALRLYPNPTSGRFALQWKSDPKRTIHYSITDMQGALVRKDVSDASHISFNLSTEAAGVYLLHVASEGVVRHFRLIKQ